MNRYARTLSPSNTPQTRPLVGSNQVANSGGGFGWEVDCWTRLDRFLILGCEGGTYYAGEQKLTIEAAESLRICAAEDAQRTVDRIVQISDEGRAAKNDPAIFCLAMLCADARYSSIALPRLSEVCRIGTHLFQFVDAVTQFRGWGRALKRAVSNWYLNHRPDRLAAQITKYKQRGGWSHRDVLRCCHAHTNNAEINQILGYAVRKPGGDYPMVTNHTLEGVEKVKLATTSKEVAALVRSYGLVRENIPTQFLNDPRVWEAMLELRMPMTALIRNLGKMTSIDVLKPNTSAVKQVCAQLRDREQLQRARVHPFSVLLALSTYQQGCGVRGSLRWSPVTQVLDSLEDAYDASFGYVEPTGQRYLLGVDVSGSMTYGTINNTHLTPRDAAGCMAATLVRSEDQVQTYGFCNTFHSLPVTKRTSLSEVNRMITGLPFGRTDCSLPMRYATQEKIPTDVFVIYTDSETNCNSVHPAVALQDYRRKMGINAKLIVVAFTANEISIADPNDAGMLDVVGFDASAPKIMADFARE
jgi:60 kDa SS-A/Ro ribonucleoprotein